MAISHCYWHLVVKNDNFTLLLTSSGQEWQFHIVSEVQWSRVAISHCYWCLVVKNAISHCYWHLVVKNGNWQIYPKICQQIYPPQMHHGIYIMKCIWQPFCILWEKVGIYCYFWIIMVVNSQLALYSHVRCYPLNTPLNTPKTPPHDNFNYEGLNLPGVICNIVVKADLGRSPGRWTPQ